MQHIKLTIPGAFWDTQLYARTLYIFGDSGNLFTINWDNYIKEHFYGFEDLQTAVHVSFLESDLFYTRGSQIIFKDSHVKDIILDRFNQLAQLELDMDLNSKSVTHSDNPLPFPHADSEIYYSKLYVGLDTGVYSAAINSSDKTSTKLWDAPVLNVSASSYTAIALAAGNEGLYEMKPHIDENIDQARQVSNNHCSSSEWSDYNITASSHVRSAFFAAYKKLRDKENHIMRELDEIIPLNEVFEHSGYSWGSHDKLYMYRNNSIECMRYSANKDSTPSFTRISTIPIADWKGEVVSASVAPFGTVIECDNAIIVIQSNGEIVTLPGEPVNWRVFSNSKLYKNQLHIIYDDRLEIYSFFHDYFVDQSSKSSGIEMKQKKV